MPRIKNFFFYALILALGLSIFPRCGLTERLQRYVDLRLREVGFERAAKPVLIRHGVVGMSYAVTDGRKIIGGGGVGIANRVTGRSANIDTKYQIASASKMITATAALLLTQRGALELDRDAADYLGFVLRNPVFPTRAITVRHLLTHTSGLVDGPVFEKFLDKTHAVDPPPLADLFVGAGRRENSRIWGANPPGTKFHYSNLGAGLIAQIIERVTGTDFNRFVRENIFQPLEMDAGFAPSDIRDYREIAVLYKRDSATGEIFAAKDDYESAPPPPDFYKYGIGYNGLFFSPQGGARISARDLARFLALQMGDGSLGGYDLLRPEFARQLTAIQWQNADKASFFEKMGLFFHITDTLLDAGPVVGHFGRAYGLRSVAYFSKELRFGAVLIFNGGQFTGPENRFEKAEKKLFGLLYEKFAQ